MIMLACVAWFSGEGEGRGNWSEHPALALAPVPPPLPSPSPESQATQARIMQVFELTLTVGVQTLNLRYPVQRARR